MNYKEYVLGWVVYWKCIYNFGRTITQCHQAPLPDDKLQPSDIASRHGVLFTQHSTLSNRFNSESCHQSRYLLGHQLLPRNPALPSDAEIHNSLVTSTCACADAHYNELRIVNGNRFFSPLPPPNQCVRTALDLKLNYRYMEASNNFFLRPKPRHHIILLRTQPPFLQFWYLFPFDCVNMYAIHLRLVNTR